MSSLPITAPWMAHSKDASEMERRLLYSRVLTALWASWIGDAIAMPTHWYYDLAVQQAQYGSTLPSTYLVPREPHPDSWVYFGEVTTDSEQERWPWRIWHNNLSLLKQPGTHYHHGMAAGENTLQMRVQEVIMKSILDTAAERRVQAGSAIPYDFEECTKRTINFMTTPGAHPDTYIGGAFQYFFRQLAADPTRNPRGKGFDDPCVGGLVLALPIILLCAHSACHSETARKARDAILREHLFLTHASEVLYEMAIDLADLVTALLHRGPDDHDLSSAARILRQSLEHLIIKNVESARDANIVCGLPKKSKQTSTSASVTVATMAKEAPAPVAVSVPAAPASNQDPVYLEWRAATLLAAPSKRQFTIDQLLAMTDREAFDAMFSVRCYAERALPGAIFLALRSCSPPSQAEVNDPQKGRIIRCLNSDALLGGDNCHRNQILGVLLGCIHGVPSSTESRAPISAGADLDATPVTIDAYWRDALRTNENAALKAMFQQFAQLCCQQFC